MKDRENVPSDFAETVRAAVNAGVSPQTLIDAVRNISKEKREGGDTV